MNTANKDTYEVLPRVSEMLIFALPERLWITNSGPTKLIAQIKSNSWLRGITKSSLCSPVSSLRRVTNLTLFVLFLPSGLV